MPELFGNLNYVLLLCRRPQLRISQTFRYLKGPHSRACGQVRPSRIDGAMAPFPSRAVPSQRRQTDLHERFEATLLCGEVQRLGLQCRDVGRLAVGDSQDAGY